MNINPENDFLNKEESDNRMSTLKTSVTTTSHISLSPEPSHRMLKAKVTEQERSLIAAENQTDYSQAETHQYVPSYRRIAGRTTAASFKPKRGF